MQGIRELLAQLKIFARFDVAVADKLEELENRIYACEQDTKRIVESYRTLDKRYSELLLVVKDIRRTGNANA